MYLCAIYHVVSAFCFLCFSARVAAIFQQCGYRYGEFFRSYGARAEILKIFRSAFLYTVALITLAAVTDEELTTTIFFCLFGIGIPLAFALGSKTVKRAKFTARFSRIYFLAFALYLSSAFALYSTVGKLQWLGFSVYVNLVGSGFCAFLTPFVLPLAAAILYPYDKFRLERGKKKCAKKLAADSGLIKIGITGSAGKTSVKNFLAEMLSAKYNVLKTPASYNTPIGICKTVENLSENHGVFIAEMGARYKGDIKELCDMVGPSVGIITAITEQHVETLGGIEGVKSTKNELIEGLCGGFAVFSSDTAGSVELYEKCKTEKYLAGINGREARAENIRVKEGKTLFDLILFGEKYRAECGVIGKHLVSDVVIAACAAKKLGISDGDILFAISRLRPEKHRMEISRLSSGVYVIDDGYNANIEGAKGAAETLASFSGNKIVVTPGIVELGDAAERINGELGDAFRGIADIMILMGPNAEAIKSGFGGKTVTVGSLKEAETVLKENLKSGDVVLFLSDVPDRYL